MSSNPLLIEPGVKYFIDETLKQCNSAKKKYNEHLLNFGLFVGFVVIVGGILVYLHKNRYKNNVKKEIAKQQYNEYVVGLVKKINETRCKEEGTKITDLPEYESEYMTTLRQNKMMNNGFNVPLVNMNYVMPETLEPENKPVYNNIQYI